MDAILCPDIQRRIKEELEIERKLKRRRNGITYILDLAAFCEIPDGAEHFQRFHYNLLIMIKRGEVLEIELPGKPPHYKLPVS